MVGGRTPHVAIDDDRLEGPINAVAPDAGDATAELTRRPWGSALRRPTVLTVPAAAASLRDGVRWDERRCLLAGARVLSRPAANGPGFEFRRGDLEAALRFELGRFLRGCGVSFEIRFE